MSVCGILYVGRLVSLDEMVMELEKHWEHEIRVVDQVIYVNRDHEYVRIERFPDSDRSEIAADVLAWGEEVPDGLRQSVTSGEFSAWTMGYSDYTLVSATIGTLMASQFATTGIWFYNDIDSFFSGELVVSRISENPDWDWRRVGR